MINRIRNTITRYLSKVHITRDQAFDIICCIACLFAIVVIIAWIFDPVVTAPVEEPKETIATEPVLTEPIVTETEPTTEPEITTIATEPEEATVPPTDPETNYTEPRVYSKSVEYEGVTYNIGEPTTDLEMLAMIIYQEAGGDATCDACRRRVGDIVLNRVNSPRFPNSIREVLLQQGQYGELYWTGLEWKDRASNNGERHAVARAYRIAHEIVNGQHSDLYGDYIWQAGFHQGYDEVYHCGHYFGK